MDACLKFDIQQTKITLDLDKTQLETQLDIKETQQKVPLKMQEIQQVATADHSKLANRDLPDQHPIGAITDLEEKLEEAGEDPDTMTNAEIDQLWKAIMN